MLLLLGAALAVVLAVQLWRTLELEASTRQLEIEKAEATGERILRLAAASRAAFAAAEGVRATLRDDEVVVDDAVGWLDQAQPAADTDLVVEDRLARASRAEFADGDAAAAARAFDELLAGPLRDAQRLQVLAAAAWQCRRAGLTERLATLVRELDAGAAALKPGDLARPLVATAAAAAIRLRAGADQPAWLPRLVALLPPGLAVGLPDLPELAQQRATARRRADLLDLRACWRRQPARGEHGIVAGADQRLLWWIGRDESRDVDALWLTPEQFVAAARAAGAAGAVPEWPWLVEPAFAAADPAAAFAGVPFVRGLVPTGASAAAQQRWLLPALTLALLAAFGLATAQQLRAQRREAAAVRAQAEFLTTVTHELKTPLASIRLLGEMLAEGRARGRETDYYRMLAGEAGRLSMLIENVLDLGRLERGERAYDLRACDVGDLVRETVALVEPVAERDAARISVQLPDGECVARVDRAALTQALISVLDNARKYGGGAIEVALQRDDARLRLTVRDHGSGVPAAERERIFDRFVRGSAHAHGSQPGVGIGLYLARTIARRLGGDLVCTAPPDGGSGALFVFDLATDPAPETPA
ncbi:MAG: HAMP domain-containing sensor histidine kinase [Planctomycetota bacterium]